MHSIGCTAEAAASGHRHDLANQNVPAPDFKQFGIDEKTAARVFEQMLELNRAQKTSLVLVTHDRSLARRLDRVLELHEGRLRELSADEI
jgi:predicted ABC-type transport system involved in lysophospholipase L1 biosynthesis ATPase subunit